MILALLLILALGVLCVWCALALEDTHHNITRGNR